MALTYNACSQGGFQSKTVGGSELAKFEVVKGPVSNPGEVLIPGTGWTGETPQPSQIGSGQASNKKPIAHWDMVPYQTVNDKINVGLLAYHFNGISHVDFSVDNGPWISVEKPVLNTATNVEEFFVTLDASKFNRDGLVEIRAIAYPNIGIPKVFQGTTRMNESSALLINVNGKGTLPHPIRYAATNGNDSNDCMTRATACLTIKRAVVSANVADISGLEVRLSEGMWDIPHVQNVSANNQYITYTSSPESDPKKVYLTGIDAKGPFDSAGAALKLMRTYNISITGPLAKAPGGDFEDYMWVDQTNVVNVIDPMCEARGTCFLTTGHAPFDGLYYTDVFMDHNSPYGGTLARNVFSERSAGGHASGLATVINYTIKTVYGSGYKFSDGTIGPDYHGDYYQGHARRDNIIIYGGKIAPGGEHMSLRGIVGMRRDVAIVNTRLNLAEVGNGGWGWSACGNAQQGAIDHLVMINTYISGAGDWCGESAAGGVVDPNFMLNILFDQAFFANGHPEQIPYPLGLPGVKVVR